MNLNCKTRFQSLRTTTEPADSDNEHKEKGGEDPRHKTQRRGVDSHTLMSQIVKRSEATPPGAGCGWMEGRQREVTFYDESY